jgi:hypothetical protein
MFSMDANFIISRLNHIFHIMMDETQDIYSSRKIWIDNIIQQLRKDLYIYVEQKLNASLIDNEKSIDNFVDSLLPIESEKIKNIVNDVVNRSMEEIVKEIDKYITERIKEIEKEQSQTNKDTMS